MTEREDLDLVTEQYTADPYERETVLSHTGYANKCIQYAMDRSTWLELGLGDGYCLQRLSQLIDSVMVLDGSPKLVRRFQDAYHNVCVKLTYFEDFDTHYKFPNIGMGFILEHVDNPEFILTKYRRLLAPGGGIYVAVPNAASLHRLIAHRAGLLDDLHLMSDADRGFGHKRFLAYDEWMGMFARVGLRVERAEGLYLKPLTTKQLESLNLDSRVFEALAEVATELPRISNNCFFVLRG